MIVHIAHNVDPENRFWSYQPGTPLEMVHTYDDPKVTDPDDAPERAFHLFNAPEEFLDETDRAIAAAYRAKRLRSLSVGDVVFYTDGTRLVGKACDSVGWVDVEDEPNIRS